MLWILWMGMNGYGWLTRGYGNRNVSPDNQPLLFGTVRALQIGISASGSKARTAKSSRNGPKTVRDDPKTVHNVPKTVRKHAKRSPDSPKTVRVESILCSQYS